MKGSQDSSNGAKPWAKLTAFTAQLDNVNLLEESYTIGRNSVNKVVVPDIRLSGVHCKIFKDDEDNIWIEDMSSNGTFIEDEKIGKGTKRKLVSGDKIYLLHKSKVKADDILGYVFSSFVEDGAKLKRQREEDQRLLQEEKKQAEKQQKFQDDLGEEMRCCICIDYIYQCVTLIPCLHNFCAACFSDWMKKSQLCPQCRESVVEIKKNATVNNIIGKFMENNPALKRPKEEYDEMDLKNTIKEDRIIMKNLKAAAAPTGLFTNINTRFNPPVVNEPTTLFRNQTTVNARGRGRGRRY